MTTKKANVFASVIGLCLALGGLSAGATEYYVNPDETKASDDYDGKAAVWDGTHGPKQTLAGVMAVAKVSGDIVHAAPGHYRSKTMTAKLSGQAEQKTLNRVVIPSGVTLTADEGRDVTFIEGEPAPEDKRVGGYGNGEGAVRCVYMKQGARLHDFTLCGGHVSATSDSDSGSEQGGAINCEGNWNNTALRNTSVITDCMISNNVGCSYAITSYGTYYRCTFVHNRITNVGGVSYGVYYNCIVDHNIGGTYSVAFPSAFVNGVIGSDCTSYCAYGSNGDGQRHFYNSIIMGKYYRITTHNCLLVGADQGACAHLDGSRTATAAQVNLDADYRPLPGSVAIDTGTNDLYAASYSTSAETEWATAVWAAESASDYVKGTRIQGARIDIGAYEFDPTPKSFYVDPVNGDDDRDGRQPGSAFKTLAGAMANPWLAAGDTVCLQPGTYAEGVVTNGNARTLNRVVVKAGVIVEGLGEQPEDVIIKGADAPVDNQVENAYGCGEGAMRCVKLTGGCILRNLTLDGGRVYVNGTTAASGYDGCAAAHCTGEGNYLINCLITNCVGLIHAIAGDEEATVKAGGRSGLIRCRICGNRTISYAGCQRLNLYNCAFYGNTGSYSVHDCYDVVNCTIMDTSSAFRESSSSVTYCTPYNCVIWTAQDCKMTQFYRCIFPNGDSNAYQGGSGYHLNDGCRKEPLPLRFRKGTYEPRRDCCLTDAGNDAYLDLFPAAFPEEKDLDLYGHARIIGAAVDVGAGEYLPSDKGMLLLFR